MGGEATASAATAIVPRGKWGEVGQGFHIREATEADLPWIDLMQKRHGRQLGFLPMMALKGKLAKGEVLVAEGRRSEEVGRRQNSESDSELCLRPTSSLLQPLGYLIAADWYFKRDEVGYVTQLCVAPHARRSLVGAALLQAQFDRSAYGCRLYSCWCAQDLAANEFWEAMGFVPIAYRTGSRREEGRGRREEGQKSEASGVGPSSLIPHPFRSAASTSSGRRRSGGG